MERYQYDVALSYAQEDRAFVRQVAEQLVKHRIRVFYDEFEQASIWGKELFEFLEDVYKNKSEYVLMFISVNYLEKSWTGYEKRAIMNRLLDKPDNTEYILPVKLDKTVLPGIHNSISYLSIDNVSPLDVCSIFCDKFTKNIRGDLPVLNTSFSGLQGYLLMYAIRMKQYAKDLSGSIGLLHDTKWSSKGRAIMYANASVALAKLELMVLYSSGGEVDWSRFALVQYIVPIEVSISSIDISDLPPNFLRHSNKRGTQAIGDAWLDKNETCILCVPSVIVPTEKVLLMNPNHKMFEKITINKIEDMPPLRRLDEIY